MRISNENNIEYQKSLQKSFPEASFTELKFLQGIFTFLEFLYFKLKERKRKKTTRDYM